MLDGNNDKIVVNVLFLIDILLICLVFLSSHIFVTFYQVHGF